MRHRMIGVTAVALVLVSGVVASIAAGSGSGAVGAASAAAPKPNILFLLTDDLDASEISVMPNLQSLLVDRGVTFSNTFVSVSLCCPSRSTMLRGQYSHNTGVQTNGGSNGGFETAHAAGLEQSTLATWLHRAGYRTALIGKYLNGYPNTVANTYVPPGWDEWDSAVGGNPYSEFGYTLNENGTLVRYGRAPSDYGTDVYTEKARSFVTKAARDHKPFFTYLAVYAPHQPATPAPRDADRFPGAQAPRTPSYDEADVADKPQWVQGRPLMSPPVQTLVDNLYRKRLQSLQAVDDAIGKLVATLRDNHQLDDTYFVFTSDNGFHLGQHRLPAGKQTAYEEDVHVPLVVRGPGVPAGKQVSRLVGNVDLAPTFADLAGAKPPNFVDGRSLAPLLRARPPSSTNWRQAYLLEHWQEPTAHTPRGGVPLEPPDSDQGTNAPPRRNRVSRAGGNAIPEYHALRTARYTYVEYVTGEKELYDVTRDPAQLDNLAATADPARLAQLHERLAALQTCKASSCRRAEARAAPG